MLIDTHCHLDFPDFAERLPDVIGAAARAGVTRMITISTRVRQVHRLHDLVDAHPELSFTVGTHPHNAADEPDVTADELVALSEHPRCVGIGEAGLDFHYDRAPRDVQERVFRTHVEAARRTGLPLVIHSRNADMDMIRVLEDEHGRGRFEAVLHCFSSGQALAQAGIALGLHVSFSGILTFKGSGELRRIAAALPPERLLVETDAPYLAPVPHRGRTNEPAFVADTARVLAEVLGLPFETAAQLTTANATRLFARLSPGSAAASRAA